MNGAQLHPTLLQDRSTDLKEPLRIYADLAGHPFCIFVADDPTTKLAAGAASDSA